MTKDRFRTAPRKAPDTSSDTSSDAVPDTSPVISPAAAAAFDKALDDALRLLGRNAYTERSLAEKLRSLGHGEQAAARVIAHLTERRYLDDARYAESYLRARAGAQGLRRMRQALAAKGVSGDAIASALESLEAQGEAPDESASALGLAFKKLAGEEWPRDPVQRRRLRDRVLRFLAGRGYSYAVSIEALNQAVRRLFDESVDED